tara:strand:+ start:12235 stop:12525 length:291 start_codon:yes stop_codon:yes gene_type:complete
MTQYEIIAVFIIIQLSYLLGVFFFKEKKLRVSSNKSELICFSTAPFYFGGWVSAYVNGVPQNPSSLYVIYGNLVGFAFLASLASFIAQRPQYNTRN